jgi:hypothetical protein
MGFYFWDRIMAGRKNRGLLTAIYSRANAEGRSAFDVIDEVLFGKPLVFKRPPKRKSTRQKPLHNGKPWDPARPSRFAPATRGKYSQKYGSVCAKRSPTAAAPIMEGYRPGQKPRLDASAFPVRKNSGGDIPGESDEL